MRSASHPVSNRKKAAIMMMILGPEISGKVMQHLDEEHVEILTLEIARLDRVTPEIRNQVIEEFHQMALAQDYIAEGGVEHAKKLLFAAFGSEKATDMIERINQTLEGVPFDFLRRSDPAQLATILTDEHPQTIALVISNLPTGLAAQVLERLNPELRVDVAERIALMERTPPEVIRRVENVLEQKTSGMANTGLASSGGLKSLVDILHHVDRNTERKILDNLHSKNPELANEVLNMMFVFEDVAKLDDRAIQQILREIEMKELALALKGTSEEVRAKIFMNMSERAADMVKETMEFLGPVKLRTVEEAQQRIVAIIRRLEEAGEISIGRGEEEVLV
ncbi:MAG TPA: flagellar motor switch protein FliG [Fimbriimonadales bacterium]|nr:flagellar motor switch protein FliG [Fimbriimonadales bacterium]